MRVVAFELSDRKILLIALFVAVEDPLKFLQYAPPL